MEDYESRDDEYNYANYDEDVDDQDNHDGFQHFEFENFDSTTAAESIKIITKHSLLAAQSEEVRNVMDVLSVKEHHARTLLVHFRWNVEKILSVLEERGQDELFSKAGLTVSKKEDLIAPAELPSTSWCAICMEDLPSDQITAMDCGHFFCNTCWTGHFIVKINEGHSRHIKCMAHKCNVICDESRVKALVKARDPTLAERFDRFLLESYIEDNEKVNWCPSVPHCGNAVRCGVDRLCEVECACGVAFCFGCLSEPHSPCSCQMWELWVSKCRDESETINWMAVNTKPCPKCRKLVEKNGGCNAVICTCGQSFCWLCGEATGRSHTYLSIEGHSCGRYIEDKKAMREKAKKRLDRYVHYHNRFKAHTDSCKLETRLTEAVRGRISMLEERDSLERDFDWLRNGLYRLFRSRKVLSYTYPFAFFMFGDLGEESSESENEIRQNLFEDLQQQLEARVESLSWCLQEPLETYSNDRVKELRMKIINLTVLIDKRCKQLYDCIENDMLGSLWSAPSIASYSSNGAYKAL